MWTRTALAWLVMLITTAQGCQRQSCPDVQGDQASDSVYVSQATVTRDKTWLFAVSGDNPPMSFLNDTGVLSGAHVDLVKAVCTEAGKQCTVVITESAECQFWQDRSYPGRGLMAGWVDACIGAVITKDRLAAVDFSLPFQKTAGFFSVAQGNPSGFDAATSDFTRFKFVGLTEMHTTPQCLTRLGKPDVNFTIAPDLKSLKEMLANKTSDVAFTTHRSIPGTVTFPEPIQCEIGGVAIATKRGAALTKWWDTAFTNFVQSGRYQNFCSATANKYKDTQTFQCLPDPLSFPPTTPSYKNGEKVWLFGTSGNRKPMTFLDEQGELQGFHKDLVALVCREAGVQCQATLMRFEECGFTGQSGLDFAGRGIMEGWVDACLGYNDSPDREATAAFTDAFLQTEAGFAVAKGNPRGFDPASPDYSGFTVTHLTGAYTNVQCLARLNKTGANIKVAASLPEAKLFLASGQADAIFSARTRIPGLDVLPHKLRCARTGSCVMVKKDNTALPAWWNAAFRSVVQQGLYHQLCRDSNAKYGYSFKCFSEDSPLPTSATLPVVG